MDKLQIIKTQHDALSVATLSTAVKLNATDKKQNKLL